MQSLVRKLRSESVKYLVWVGLCFALTSAIYLSWLDRLVQLAGSPAADWCSMVAGYFCQAAGLGVTQYLIRRDPSGGAARAFSPAALLLAAVSVPALLAHAIPGAVCFGLLMNLLCGVIAGFYLYGIAARVDERRRSLVFGGGYALATVAVGLLALIGGGALVRGRCALLVYLPLTAGLLLVTSRLRPLQAEHSAPTPEAPLDPDARTLALACGVVVLISAVKNLGFGFPSSDIMAGLIPEVSRLPYAAGLAAAGLIHDGDRKRGLVCTVAALIVPFIMLGLTGEPVSRAVFWGLDYVFYGFFSVFRAVLFLDLAGRTRRWALAPVGLLMGRLGDAAGTSVCILLGGSRIALITVSAVLFIPSVFLLLRLYQRLYQPEAARQKTEQEVFETFCLHNDLSAREREIFRMLIESRTNGEIAEALFISENTVKYHVRNVLQKTGCKNRGELQKKYTLALYPDLQAEGRGA